jgi:uncharacterized protein (DUF1684 family)
MDRKYQLSIQEWRKDYEAKLAAPDGWLSISGLYWLKEGDNRFGAAPDNEVVLPAGSAPMHAGLFNCQGSQITLLVERDVMVTCNDQPLSELLVKLNQFGSSEWFVLNGLKFAVIQRGVRYGVRIYDENNPTRKQFASLRWFPVDESLCIMAKWMPYDKPVMISILNVLGDTLEEPCPGYAEFTLLRNTLRLYPISPDGEERLWFLFKDATNGSLTYPGGRFLWAQPPQDGHVTLDFNKTYNPPCSYTDFATCPLPPSSNYLKEEIQAGEMKFR